METGKKGWKACSGILSCPPKNTTFELRFKKSNEKTNTELSPKNSTELYYLCIIIKSNGWMVMKHHI